LKPEVRRRKLDQKADIGIFIGYSTTSKAYKVYDLNFNKVVVTRNVKVVENATWDWKNSSGEGSKQIQQDELDAANMINQQTDVAGNIEQQTEWDAAENIDDQSVRGQDLYQISIAGAM